MKRFIPHVSKNFLILLAGYVWICVGLMMIYRAWSWLAVFPGNSFIQYSVSGLVLGLLIHHFGFLKIVNKNLKRIFHMANNHPVTSFIPGKSYLLILLMMTGGMLLRHSSIPRQYLATVYLGIGLALILSSVRYLRVCFTEFLHSVSAKYENDTHHGRYR